MSTSDGIRGLWPASGYSLMMMMTMIYCQYFYYFPENQMTTILSLVQFKVINFVPCLGLLNYVSCQGVCGALSKLCTQWSAAVIVCGEWSV